MARVCFGGLECGQRNSGRRGGAVLEGLCSAMRRTFWFVKSAPLEDCFFVGGLWAPSSVQQMDVELPKEFSVANVDKSAVEHDFGGVL